MLFARSFFLHTNKINCEGENAKVNYMEWDVSELPNKNECYTNFSNEYSIDLLISLVINLIRIIAEFFNLVYAFIFIFPFCAVVQILSHLIC